MHIDDTFTFRRQFILGPKHANFHNWSHVNLSGFCISTHPDLECIQESAGDIQLTLIGYMLNPYQIEADNRTILKEILSNLRDKNDLFERVYPYGGRWVIIYKDRYDAILLHDFSGLRQVYYTTDATLWCGSQPEIIAQHTHSEKNNEINQELLNAGVFEIWANHFWPGDGSLYHNIKRLLPNHYLDLNRRTVQRYWPCRERKAVSLEQGVETCSSILKNLIKSAAKRFPLAQSITAGWDSRLILAASRECFDDILYYTYIRRNLNKFSPDIRIPEKILKKYKRQLIRVHLRKEVDKALQAVFEKNTSISHLNVLYDADALLRLKERLKTDFVTINGNISETARCFYYDPATNMDIEPGTMAGMVNMAGSQYAKVEFGKWLQNARPIIEGCHYHILDFFYLEQKIGGWFSSLRTEYDIAEEVFAPYNCRLLLDTMLSIDNVYRQKKNPAFYKKMIKVLWPEVMAFPVNPPDLILNFKFITKNKILIPMAQKIKLYDVIKDHSK